MLLHADLSVRASFERAAAKAEAAAVAAAVDKATSESIQAAAWEAMDKAGAAAEAVADAEEAKYREQQAAELKDSLELGVGTTECRKQMALEMQGSEGGSHGLDATTGEGLKFNNRVLQLQAMRVKVEGLARRKREREGRAPLNAPVCTNSGSGHIFLGRAAQASETTLPSAPLAGAVECAAALVKLAGIQGEHGKNSAQWKQANDAHRELLDWTLSRGTETVFSVDLEVLGPDARVQLRSGSTEQQDTLAKRALEQSQADSRLEREARKARNLLFANAWLGLGVDGKQTKYFKMLAWFKEQDELANHRRTNKSHSLLKSKFVKCPDRSSLGGAGHASNFGSSDWLSPSDPPSEQPKRARVGPKQLCVAKRTTVPFDISFIFGLGASLPTCEQLDGCMRREVAAAEAPAAEAPAAEAPAAAPLAYRDAFGVECDVDDAVDYGVMIMGMMTPCLRSWLGLRVGMGRVVREIKLI